MECYGNTRARNKKSEKTENVGKRSMDEKRKVLLIGVGGYGKNYIKEMTEQDVPGAKLEGICEIMPDVKEVYPVIEERRIPVYATPEEFYKEHEADLAVISTPIQLHYEQILTCLNHGSHVLTEKPVCTSVKGARELEKAERRAERFVAVGYQLNYSRDVLAMKSDILDGKFGKPLLFKACHAMARGRSYYQRNNWAGKITINGCKVNDSPFNNACAHQFQNMTFLLGDAMDRAAELGLVEGEVYRANRDVENFDTAAVKAMTKTGVPIYYYTSHALREKHLGPVCEYQFENAVIFFGKDFGEGPVNEYVVEWKDGRRQSYKDIEKGLRMQKLYDALECAGNGKQPVCTVQCAIPHLEAVTCLAELPIHSIREEEVEHVEEEGDWYCRIRNLEDIFLTCYKNNQLPSQMGVRW